MLGLQLYTVRQKTKDEESALAALTEIKNMGYECVQLAGSVETIELCAKAALKAGLAVIGILADMKTCEDYGEKLFELARLCGAGDIGISSFIKTEEEAYDIVKRANAFAKIANEKGFSFSYHNHSNEFMRAESGKLLMDILLEGFDSERIRLMPDTYWLQHGGVDVRAFLEKSAGRVEILHLKDMKRNPDATVTFAEIGRGNINFDGIIKTALNIGVKHFIVEQDKCDGDSIESAKISCEYLRKIFEI